VRRVTQKVDDSLSYLGTRDNCVQLTLQQVSNWNKLARTILCWIVLYQQPTVAKSWKCKNESISMDIITRTVAYHQESVRCARIFTGCERRRALTLTLGLIGMPKEFLRSMLPFLDDLAKITPNKVSYSHPQGGPKSGATLFHAL